MNYTLLSQLTTVELYEAYNTARDLPLSEWNWDYLTALEIEINYRDAA